jgi:hypothetical protein
MNNFRLIKIFNFTVADVGSEPLRAALVASKSKLEPVFARHDQLKTVYEALCQPIHYDLRKGRK